jgi:hypothetical protein
MPSASQRSSVRGFRRSSEASSSLVRYSERIGSTLDMSFPYISATVRLTEVTRAAIRFGMEWCVLFSFAQPCLDCAVAVSDPSRA